MKTFGKIILLLGVMVTVIASLQLTTKDFLRVTPEQISNSDGIALYWSPITAVALLTAGIIILVISTKEKKYIHK
jgi:hypothetical protein